MYKKETTHAILATTWEYDFDVSINSKLKRVVFELYNFVYLRIIKYLEDINMMI